MSGASESQKVIERIRKLLDMASHPNSNENEAMIAMTRAEKLMRKHQIGMADITAARLTADDMVKRRTESGSYRRLPQWVWQLAWAAADLTDTKPWTERDDGLGYVIFCGASEDVAVAALFHAYLTKTVDRLATQLSGSRASKGAFRRGASDRIVQRATEISRQRAIDFEQTTGTQLVALKGALVEDAFNLKYAEPPKQKIETDRGYLIGARAGDNVSLNRQIGGKTQEAISEAEA